MADILVIGHRNPDTDSICSAIAYATLKGRVDPENTYLSCRCGTINSQTRYVLERFSVAFPQFVKDVYPRVDDIMSGNVISVAQDAPVLEVMRHIDEQHIRVIPVVDEEARYRGVVSILEIADFLMAKNVSTRPSYPLRPGNFGRVLPGRILQRGEREGFTANVVVAAMPFDGWQRVVDGMGEQKPVVITGNRTDIIRDAVGRQLPAIILTGIEDGSEVDGYFADYRGWVFLSERDTAETLRLVVMSVPVHEIMNPDVPTLGPKDYADDARTTLMSIDQKGMPVIDDGQRLAGIVTRSDLICATEKNLILVDHNELGQAVEGADRARILEIVDHHRLGTVKTKDPVTFFARPLGSTCTVVSQLFRFAGQVPDRETASLLLAGILSDTVIGKSPTTTHDDLVAMEELGALAHLDVTAFGTEIFSATEGLRGRDPREVITGDFKIYDEYGVKAGIGQVEVVTMSDLEGVKQDLRATLGAITSDRGLQWGMLLITDIIQETSLLLTTGHVPAERHFRYRMLEKGLFSLPGVLSRKKQLLPEVFRVLEEAASG